MNRLEFERLTDEFSPLDEVCLVSPGGKEMRVTGIDRELSIKHGKIVLTSEWGLNDDGEVETIVKKPVVRKKTYKKKPAKKKTVRKPKPKTEETPAPVLDLAPKKKRGRPAKNPANNDPTMQ